MIDLLLKYGANIDVRIDSKLGYTILMKLASTEFLDDEKFENNVEIMEFLIERGADKNIKSNQGESALDFAKKMNWEHIIPVLEK